MIDLQIQHHFSSGVYARQMFLPAGHVAQSHRHHFEHLSILAQGEIVLTVNGDTTTYQAPACITIAAHAVHSITAVTDTHWFCIHATQETDAEQIDHNLVEGA